MQFKEFMQIAMMTLYTYVGSKKIKCFCRCIEEIISTQVGRKILEGGLFFNFHTLHLQDVFLKKMRLIVEHNILTYKKKV